MLDALVIGLAVDRVLRVVRGRRLRSSRGRSRASSRSVTEIVLAAPVTWPDSTSLLFTTDAYTCELVFALILLAIVASESPAVTRDVGGGARADLDVERVVADRGGARRVRWVTWSADASRWTPIWKPPAAAPPVQHGADGGGVRRRRRSGRSPTRDGSRSAWAASAATASTSGSTSAPAGAAVSMVLCWVSSISGWRSIDSSWSMIEFVSRPEARPPTLKNGVAVVDLARRGARGGRAHALSLLVDQKAAARQHVEHAPRGDLADHLAVRRRSSATRTLPVVVVDVEVQVDLPCGEVRDHLLRRAPGRPAPAGGGDRRRRARREQNRGVDPVLGRSGITAADWRLVRVPSRRSLSIRPWIGVADRVIGEIGIEFRQLALISVR